MHALVGLMKVLQPSGDALTNHEVAAILEVDQTSLKREDLTQEELRRRFCNASVLDYLNKKEFKPTKERQERIAHILVDRFNLKDSEVLQILNSQPRSLEHLWLLLASGEGEAFQLRYSRAVLGEVLECIESEYLGSCISQDESETS